MTLTQRCLFFLVLLGFANHAFSKRLDITLAHISPLSRIEPHHSLCVPGPPRNSYEEKRALLAGSPFSFLGLVLAFGSVASDATS